LGTGANFAPRVFLVMGLPEGVNYYWSIKQTSYGWVAASATGVVEQKHGIWRLFRHPSHAEVKVAVPYSGGILVAGTGVCDVLREDGTWTKTGIRGNFYSGVASADGSLAFAASQRNVYLYKADGSHKVIFSADRDRDVFVHRIGPHVVIFADAEALVFDGKNVVPATSQFGWLKSRTPFLFGNEDSFVAISSTALVHGSWEGGASKIFPELWSTFRHRSPVGVATFGRTVVLASYFDGIKGIDLSSCEERWSVPADQFGGNVWCLSAFEEGLLVGATDGIYFVPNPDTFKSSQYAKRDIYFSYETSLGPLIVGGAGVLKPDGAAMQFPDRVISLSETRPGEFVFGGLGSVAWGDRTFKMPGHREVMMMSRAGGDAVLTVQPTGASIVQRDGTVIPLLTNGTAYSVAEASPNLAMVGTTEGAFIFDQKGGHAELQRIGRGLSLVKRVGDISIIVDALGDVFDSGGNRLGHVPLNETIDAVRWRDNVYLLGRSRDNLPVVGEFSLSGGRWRALDLPLTAAPTYSAVRYTSLGPARHHGTCGLQCPPHVPSLAFSHLQL